MKDMDQKLDKLFAQAKNEAPLFSLGEVENKLEGAPVSNGFFARYWPLLMKGLVLVSAGLIYFNSDWKREKTGTKINLNESYFKSDFNDQDEVSIPKVIHEPTKTSDKKETLNNDKHVFNIRSTEIEKIKYLELQNDELQALGIEMKRDTIRVHDAKKDMYVLWEVTKGSNSARIFSEADTFTISKYKQFRLRHITRSVDGELSKAVEFRYSDSINYNYLLPIKIKSDIKKSTTEYFVWYDLTYKLISALPLRYRNELQQELAMNQQITEEPFAEQTNCGYLETFCRDISIFDRIRVFPNPASTYMSAHFETLEDCQLSIDLMNIEGRLVQNLFTGTINAGPQRIPLDVGNIDPDLYLLKFEASNGEYETTRVIIKN